MYASMKSCSRRVRRLRGIPALFVLSLLALALSGLAPDAAAQKLHLSMEEIEADEGNTGVKRYTVTVTATKAPGWTDTGRTKIYRFVYKVSGTAASGADYTFGGSTSGNNIEGSATTHTSTLTIKGDTEQEEDESVIIKITRNDVHTFGLDRYPRSLEIGTSTVTFTIKDDD